MMRGGSRKLTLAKIHELLERLNDKEGDRYRVNDRVKLFVQEKNAGKRAALVRGVEQTDTDLVMFVDSVRARCRPQPGSALPGTEDGPLSCYRRDLVMKYKDRWINQRFLGHKATFGDDRAMTNFILDHHRCGYQDTAVCSTIVPHKLTIVLE